MTFHKRRENRDVIEFLGRFLWRRAPRPISPNNRVQSPAESDAFGLTENRHLLKINHTIMSPESPFDGNLETFDLNVPRISEPENK